jgi:Rod binding domain-containing protein
MNAAPYSLNLGQPQTAQSPKEQARQVAEQFEGIFINQMLSSMFEGIGGEDDIFNGGYAEETYRGLMTETYADAITKSGGIGIADNIMRELIGLQEIEK